MVEVKPDSPAARAGIEAQDVLLSVNGMDVRKGMTMQQWTSQFGAPIGTVVTLLLRHPNGLLYKARPVISDVSKLP